MPGLELWVLRVADVDTARLELCVLDAEERERAARIAPQDRPSFLAAHLLLRQLLAARLDVEPQEISYRRESCPRCGGPRGRPALEHPDTPLYFSLSRRIGLVMVALARDRVGVDVEALPPATAACEVAELLHPAERAEILAAGSGARAEVFARVWTRKEAYLKGLGIGVAHDLAAEYLGGEERAAGPAGWTVTGVAVGAGYRAAVAVQRS